MTLGEATAGLRLGSEVWWDNRLIAKPPNLDCQVWITALKMHSTRKLK